MLDILRMGLRVEAKKNHISSNRSRGAPFERRTMSFLEIDDIVFFRALRILWLSFYFKSFFGFCSCVIKMEPDEHPTVI